MRLKPMLLMFLVVAFHLAAGETVRIWTNQNGKTIKAALKAYDGVNVTLERNGRAYEIPADSLSVEDQSFLKAYAEEEAARLARIRKGTYELTLEKKMFADPQDYYSSTIGRSTKRALKDEGLDPLAIAGTAPENETARVYVPEQYDGKKPYGIYLHISPSPGPDMPNYQSILAERNLIMASPAKGGNEEEVMRRIMLALDTVATLQDIYNIDPKRIYVGGFSGGGISAMMAQLIYPEIWAGCISHSRGMNLGFFGEFHSETRNFDESDFQRMSRMKQRFAVLSGAKDFNYEHCRDSSADWKNEGYDIRFFDVDGMGHQDAPAKAFEEALDWVCED